jgi:Cu/Ag efflux protein CusF
MLRLTFAATLALAIPAVLIAQDAPQRGTIKSVEADKGTITITADGKDHEFAVTGRTRIMDGDGTAIEKGIKDERLKAGAAVMFRGVERDGRVLLDGLRLVGGPQRPREGQGGEIRRAKIKKLDLEKMTITLLADGKEHVLGLSEETQVIGATGKELRERLKDFKEGADVQFQAAMRDGKPVVRAIRLADAAAPGRPAEPGTRTSPDTSKLKPLTELGNSEYQGFKGGLYPDGKNERPAAHEAAGVDRAKSVRPLNTKGEPSDDGKIVLLSVGMSNATQSFSVFKQLADSDQEKNPKLVIVDGAQGGMTAAIVQNPDDGGRGSQYWNVVDERLKASRVTREQVQVAWIKEADAGPSQGFPKYAQTLQQELAQIARVLHQRFPNLKLAYFSPRTYGGYATTRLNPEPYAYESGFAIKWLIEQQLRGDESLNFDPAKGEVKAPWLSWGAYLWANGQRPIPDGLSYEASDFGGDGTHPSQSGRRKVAELLLKVFKTDTTTRPWFVADPRRRATSDSPDRPNAAANPNARPETPADDQPALTFRFFDRNRDGAISREEIENAVKLFDKLDRNDDGQLDRQELTRATRGGGRPGEVITPAARGERHSDTLAVGDDAPDFTLPTPDGKSEVKLSSFRGKRPVVLVFSSFT